jgi:ABC-2 type transport system permease protein
VIDALRFECATCHEYRHGTIQPTLMAIPQRSTLLIAKIILVVLAAIVD